MFKGRNVLTESFIKDRIDVDPVSACWNWTGYSQSGGYGQFRQDGKPTLAHRASWQVFNQSQIPYGLCVLQRCDNRKCVNPKHLFLGAHRDNAHDCIAKKRNLTGFCQGHMHGVKKRQRKLTDDQVREIRATRWREPLADTAARYGISVAHVSMLRRGKRKQLVAR